MLYRFGRVLLSPFLRVVYRLRVEGLEHVPKKGKLIVCCNHSSLLDPCLLGIALKTRPIRYMAKSELFDAHGRLFRSILQGLGTFPVQRDTGDTSSMRTAVTLLDNGELLGIFPQGKCVPVKMPFQPKAGVAMIAGKTHADVLPACIYSDGTVRAFHRVTVRFGPVIPFESLHLENNTKTEIKTAACLIADRVNHLLEEGY